MTLNGNSVGEASLWPDLSQAREASQFSSLRRGAPKRGIMRPTYSPSQKYGNPTSPIVGTRHLRETTIIFSPADDSLVTYVVQTHSSTGASFAGLGRLTYTLMAVLSDEGEPSDDVVERASSRDVVHQHRPDRSCKKRLRDGLERKFSCCIPNLTRKETPTPRHDYYC